MSDNVSAGTIAVKILLFSVLKEKIGASELNLTIDSGITGGQLLEHLSTTYQVISAIRPTIRIAVNESYVNDNHQLADGDEIALITPVSGG